MSRYVPNPWHLGFFLIVFGVPTVSIQSDNPWIMIPTKVVGWLMIYAGLYVAEFKAYKFGKERGVPREWGSVAVKGASGVWANIVSFPSLSSAKNFTEDQNYELASVGNTSTYYFVVRRNWFGTWKLYRKEL